MAKLKITKEIAEKVIYLDCREEKNIRRLEKSLMKLPFIKDEDDMDTDNLEKIIKKIESKSMMHLGYIMRSVVAAEDHYSGMLKTESGPEKGKWIKTIYGLTVWEIFAKTVFYMYYYIEKLKQDVKNKKGSKG